MLLRCGGQPGLSLSTLLTILRRQARHSSVFASAKPPRAATQSLLSTHARTRFAPSPTGYLHLGSLRTALFNYLLAKATDGQFILRVEDTDKTRTVQGAEDRLCADLRWAGLLWDEGPEVGGPYGPYRQSERKDLYRNHADDLLASGKAYRCFCSEERLRQLTEQRSKLGMPTNYDRACAGIPNEVSEDRAAKGEPYTIRFRSPPIYPDYHDLVYGKVGTSKLRRKGASRDDSYDDFILLKSDGMPTYHLANVIDDHHMRITHVIRATEWMPSTPKHLALYNAFHWQPPLFAHVGLLVDRKAQKLSKRNASADLQLFVDQGIFPEALTNYLALLGWSHQQQTDFLPMKDLIAKFDLKFTKGNTAFDLRKLQYLQLTYARKYVEEGGSQFENLVRTNSDLLRHKVDSDGLYVPPNQSLESYVAAILRADVKHSSEPKMFVERNLPFFEKALVRSPPTDLEKPKEVIERAVDRLAAISESDWSAENIKAKVDALALDYTQAEFNGSISTAEGLETNEKARKKAGARISRTLRWAIMGGKAGPPMIPTMEILGRECTLARLQDSQSDALE